MQKLSELLDSYTTGWVVLILLVAEAAFPAAIMPMTLAPLQNTPGAAGIIDFLFFYTPSTVSAMIASYGDAGRDAYLTFLLVTDIAHPAVYALFFSVLITWLFRRGVPQGSRWQQLNLVPFGSLLCDVLENLSVAALVVSYPSPIDPIAWLATAFTMAKWIFTASSFGLVLIGATLAIMRRLGSA